MNLSKIPHTDLSRPVDEELIEEIQARLDNGWRVRNDIQLLLDFARKVISETGLKADRGVCQGISCPSNGCCKGNSQFSSDIMG
jgi:hypothetical protein